RHADRRLPPRGRLHGRVPVGVFLRGDTAMPDTAGPRAAAPYACQPTPGPIRTSTRRGPAQGWAGRLVNRSVPAPPRSLRGRGRWRSAISENMRFTPGET